MVREVDYRKTIDAYERTAEAYHERTKDLEPGQLEVRKKFIDLLPERGKILDIACGSGRDAKLFSDLGFVVVGIDASVAMIEKARTVAPKAQFYVKDMMDLPFDANSFDGVIYSGGLFHLEKTDAPRMMGKIYTMLTIGSPLFLSVKRGKGEGLELDKRYNVEKFFSYYEQEEIEELVRSTGFEIVDTIGKTLDSSYHTNPWIYLLARKV
jgi:SAM-dependent methyltransferase